MWRLIEAAPCFLRMLCYYYTNKVEKVSNKKLERAFIACMYSIQYGVLARSMFLLTPCTEETSLASLVQIAPVP